MGVDYISPEFQAKLKAGLQFMLNHNAPYLVHCNEGKDRAGVIAALLEALMGASPEEIVDDYMASYVNYYGFVKGEERYNVVSKIMLDILKDFNGGTEPQPGETAGAAEKYLRNIIGLGAPEISALKLKLSGK
jgi:protein tyrosine/serine phosphatase